MSDIISYIPIGSAVIAGVSGWVGYKLNNKIKMKSEIEDSRIEWIQQVRSINLNIIQSSYQFIIKNESYIETKKLLDETEKKQKEIIEGYISQINRKDDKSIEENYEKSLRDIVSVANNQFANLEKKTKQRLKAMYTVFSYVEQMKNLFPIKKYSIEKRKLINKNILIAKAKQLNYIKEDETIGNEEIQDVLQMLKENIKSAYEQKSTFEEKDINVYAILITDYLKIEWEKVKSRKG